MIDDPALDATAARLRSVIAAGNLPPRAAGRAEALLARLDTPVRIALVGPEPSGRGAALAALTGDHTLAAIPDLPERPPLELRWGAEARLSLRLGCGGVAEAADLAAALADPEAALVTVERPVPELRRIALTDIVTEPSPDDLLAALAWAGRRADVAVWWSRRFGPDERAAWRSAPARLRDHGFLLVAGSDDGAQRAAAGAADDFLRVVAARPGEAAGPRLAAEVARHVALGRQADADAVLLFLQGHVDADAPVDPAHVAPARAAPAHDAPAHDAPAPVAVTRAAAEPVARGQSAQAATPSRSERPLSVGAARSRDGAGPARHDPAPSGPATPDGAAPDGVRPGLSGPLRTFCREAAARIRLRARQLGQGTGGRAGPPVARVGADTVRALVEALDDLGDDGAAACDTHAMDELAAVFAAAEETLVLLEAETGLAAAHDAVRVLAQLRHVLETRAAA